MLHTTDFSMSKVGASKGQGNRRGSPAGHRNSGLIYGNGCYKHADCFTCPFDECTFQSSAELYHRKKT